MLAGCAVGPDYVRPQIKTPAGWSAPAPHGGTEANLVGWWERFGDPVLTGLQQRAEAHSPTLDQAVARIDQARATLSANRAQGLPSVSGSGSYSVSEQRMRMGGQTVETSTDGFRYGGDASWEIDLFGKVRRNVQAAKARSEARVDDWHDARVSLAAEVADLYVQYRGCEQLVTLYREQVQSQAESARLTRINADAGFTAPADAALTEASAANLRSLLTDQLSQCDLLVKSLTSLTAMDEAALRDMLRPGTETLPAPAELNVQSVPADLIRQRPDIVSAERELAATSAEIGVATADLYPSLKLGGSISLGGGTRQWSFGPSLSLPIFDGGRARAGVRSARANYDLQLATYRERIRAGLLEVEQALVRLDAVRVREGQAAEAARGFQANFNATDRMRQAGFASVIDRETSRRNALDAQKSVIDLKLLQLRNWIALYKALGGGWQADTVLSPNSTTGADPS